MMRVVASPSSTIDWLSAAPEVGSSAIRWIAGWSTSETLTSTLRTTALSKAVSALITLWLITTPRSPSATPSVGANT